MTRAASGARSPPNRSIVITAAICAFHGHAHARSACSLAPSGIASPNSWAGAIVSFYSWTIPLSGSFASANPTGEFASPCVCWCFFVCVFPIPLVLVCLLPRGFPPR